VLPAGLKALNVHSFALPDTNIIASDSRQYQSFVTVGRSRVCGVLVGEDRPFTKPTREMTLTGALVAESNSPLRTLEACYKADPNVGKVLTTCSKSSTVEVQLGSSFQNVSLSVASAANSNLMVAP
jgi:hypothetical protein